MSAYSLWPVLNNLASADGELGRPGNRPDPSGAIPGASCAIEFEQTENWGTISADVSDRVHGFLPRGWRGFQSQCCESPISMFKRTSGN